MLHFNFMPHDNSEVVFVTNRCQHASISLRRFGWVFLVFINSFYSQRKTLIRQLSVLRTLYRRSQRLQAFLYLVQLRGIGLRNVRFSVRLLRRTFRVHQATVNSGYYREFSLAQVQQQHNKSRIHKFTSSGRFQRNIITISRIKMK